MSVIKPPLAKNLSFDRAPGHKDFKGGSGKTVCDAHDKKIFQTSLIMSYSGAVRSEKV